MATGPAARAPQTDTGATLLPQALRWGALLLTAGFLGYYICSGMPQVALEVFPRTIALHAVTFGIAVLYAVYLIVRRRPPGGSPLDWPLAAFLAAYLLATAASVDRRVSLESTLMVLMAILVFSALADIHFLDATSLARALMLAGAAAAVWALWNVAGDYADWLEYARTARGGDFQLGDLIPPTVPKVHGVSDHPNILGMTLTLVIPFYVVGAWRAPSSAERVACAVALIAAAWAVFLTLSRGAWIGAVAGGAVALIALVLINQRWTRQAWSRANILGRLRDRHSLLPLGLGLAVALATVIAFLLIATQWEARPQWLFRESLSPRQDVFEAGVDMFSEHPLLGAGPGAFVLLYPEYSGKYLIHGVHTHNGYLQLAVDTGIVGILALVSVAVVAARMVWRSLRAGDASHRLLAVAAGSALVGFAAHNVADAANVWKAPLIALAAVLAITVKNHASAISTAPSPSGASSPPRDHLPLSMLRDYAPRVFIALAFIALFVAWGRIDAAHYHYSQSLHYLREGNDFQAISEAREAADMDPDLAIYQLQLGLTESLAFSAGGPEAFLSQSIKHLEEGVRLEPRSAIGYANLARAHQLAGQTDEALGAAREARRLAGADATLLVAVGDIFEDIGAEEDAVEAYGAAITEMVSLADSTFWLASDFRRDHYQDILARSILGLSPCAEGSLLAQASTGSAELIEAQLPDLKETCSLYVIGHPDDLRARVDLAHILMALADSQSAFNHIDYAVKREPDLALARTALGSWYAAGDTQRAREEWILAGQLGDPRALVLLGDTYPPGQVPKEVIERLDVLALVAAGGARSYPIGFIYYRMKFLRESPPSVLLPGGWQDALPGEYEDISDAFQRWQVSR